MSGEESGFQDPDFPAEVSKILGLPRSVEPDRGWDTFLSSFGELLFRAASHVHRGHDAAMDAYAFILERLRQKDFHRLRMFPGGDREALSRWLVIVARRLCSDLRRQKYGRVRETTSDYDREVRRRLADELWEAVDPGELPTGKSSNPEWDLRLRQRREALQTVMEGLDPKEQLLLAFRFDDGLSAKEISELMGFPTPFHVYRRLKRILALLREKLTSLGVEDSHP